MAGRLQLCSRVSLYFVDVTPAIYNIPYIVSYVADSGGNTPLIVVDPGPACCVKPLLELLDRLEAGKRGVEVFVTHVHIDHAGAAGLLASRYGARVYVHPRGAPHLVDTSRLWRASREYLGWIAEAYGEPARVPRELVSATSDGQEKRLDGLQVRVLHTPGHASHHQSIVVEGCAGGRLLFPGDSAGIVHPAVDAVVPTTPPPLRLELYRESLKRQIQVEPDIVAYTHTGPGHPEMLVRHLEQLDRWERILWEEYQRGASLDEAFGRVRREDPETRAFVDAIEPLSKPLIEAVKHSVDGFLQYFKWLVERRREG